MKGTSRPTTAMILALRTTLAAAGCGTPAPRQPQAPATLPDQVVSDFEQATLARRDAYVALFDFQAVGVFEILLHRYDLLGRLAHLDEAQQAELAREDGTPYPPERERTNVGNFYPLLAQRTVGTGGCTARAPRTRYARLLGDTYPPLPPGLDAYELLRTRVNAWLATGGVVSFACAGGKGGLAVVYTASRAPRGYDLITIYDD